MPNIDRFGISLLPREYLPEIASPEQSRMVAEKLRENIGQILPNGHGMSVRYMKGAIIPVYPPVLPSIMRFNIEQLRAILLTRSVFQKLTGPAEMVDVVTQETRTESDYIPVKPPRNVRRGRFNSEEYREALEREHGKYGKDHPISPEELKNAQQSAAVSAMYTNPIRDKATLEETEVTDTVISRKLLTPDPAEVEYWQETMLPPELQDKNINIILVRSINGITDDQGVISEQTEVIRAVGSWIYQKFSPHSKIVTIQPTFADSIGYASEVAQRDFLNTRNRGEELLNNAGGNLWDLVWMGTKDKIHIPIIFIQKDLPMTKKIEMLSNLDKFIDYAIGRCGNCTVVQLGQEREDLSDWLGDYRDYRLLNVAMTRRTAQEGILKIIDNIVGAFAGN